MRLTVRNKLLSIIVLLALGMFGLSSYLLVKLEEASNYTAAIYQQDFHNALAIAEINGLLMRADITVLRMFAIGDPASITQWKKENEERFSAVEKYLDALTKASSGQQSTAINNLRTAYHRMQAGMRHQVERIEAGDIEGGTEINQVEVKTHSNQVFSILEEMKRYAQTEAKERVSSNLSSAARARHFSIVLAAVVSVIAIGLGLYVVRSVTTSSRATCCEKSVQSGPSSSAYSNSSIWPGAPLATPSGVR